jgi:hypothetical protein
LSRSVKLVTARNESKLARRVVLGESCRQSKGAVAAEITSLQIEVNFDH